jgi:hypothetical protein
MSELKIRYVLVTVFMEIPTKPPAVEPKEVELVTGVHLLNNQIGITNNSPAEPKSAGEIPDVELVAQSPSAQ